MDRLQEYAQANNRTVSDIVEVEMRKLIGLDQRTEATRKPRKVAPKGQPQEVEAQVETVSNNGAITESPADRRARVLRESTERHSASGIWEPQTTKKKVNKALPFNRISRMGKRPSIPSVTPSSSFAVDGNHGIVEELTTSADS